MSRTFEKSRRKRIIFFYNRPIQIFYALGALFLIFVTILAYTYLLYSQVSATLNDPNLASQSDFEMVRVLVLDGFIRTTAWGAVVCLLVSGGTAAVMAMLITHRYEGPLIRINKHLRNLVDDIPTQPLVPRKKDEVDELITTVNELTAKIESSRLKK